MKVAAPSSQLGVIDQSSMECLTLLCVNPAQWVGYHHLDACFLAFNASPKRLVWELSYQDPQDCPQWVPGEYICDPIIQLEPMANEFATFFV